MIISASVVLLSALSLERLVVYVAKAVKHFAKKEAAKVEKVEHVFVPSVREAAAVVVKESEVVWKKV